MTASALATEWRVPLADLRRACDSFGHDFAASDELPDGPPYLGQQRAVDAIRFGIRVNRPGYNIYVLGPHGSHRHGLAEELAAEYGATKGPPQDWCYVNNFQDPERPQALSFAAGKGGVFRDDMHRLIEDMRLAIPAAFEGDDYKNQLRAIEDAAKKDVEEMIGRAADAVLAIIDDGIDAAMNAFNGSADR